MDTDIAKKAAAEKAVSYVKENMIVGIGTGSTTFYAIEAIGKLGADGLRIKGVPTSLQTAKIAGKFNIPLIDDFTEIDITIDGADEVDENGNLIKGGGGALTREKIVAAASKKEIIIADASKTVKTLGRFPLPVEVLPFGWQFAQMKLQALGCETVLRKKDGEIFTTDNGNYILDCKFGQINSPETLSVEINSIPGVVEQGLFVGLTDLVIIGNEAGGTEEFIF